MASDERSVRTQQTLTFEEAITGIRVAAGFNVWEQTRPSICSLSLRCHCSAQQLLFSESAKEGSFSDTRRQVNALEGGDAGRASCGRRRSKRSLRETHT